MTAVKEFVRNSKINIVRSKFEFKSALILHNVWNLTFCHVVNMFVTWGGGGLRQTEIYNFLQQFLSDYTDNT